MTEGVVFSLCDGLELMRDLGANFEQVIASGGETKHPLWLQLQADMYFEDMAQACTRCVTWSEETYAPRKELTHLYRRQVEQWRAIGVAG